MDEIKPTFIILSHQDLPELENQINQHMEQSYFVLYFNHYDQLNERGTNRPRFYCTMELALDPQEEDYRITVNNNG